MRVYKASHGRRQLTLEKAVVLVATIGFGMNQNTRLARLQESIAGERSLNYRMNEMEEHIAEVVITLQGSDSTSGLIGYVVDIKHRLTGIERKLTSYKQR